MTIPGTYSLGLNPLLIEISNMFLVLHLLLSGASADMTGYIVGGQFASIENWPFIASMIAFRDEAAASICGSSLISSQTVLTAAHCLDDVTNKKEDFEKYKFSVFMGHSRFTNATLQRIGYDYVTHEKYDPDGVHFDIGVLFLSQPVVFLPTVRKVLMIKKGMEVAGKGLAVAGWGRYSPEGHISEVLKSLNQSLIEWARCYEIMEEEDRDPGTVCAGKLDWEQFADSGDSGGPLVRLEGQLIVGIVSYKPIYTRGISVYTSVAYYYSWIAETQGKLFSKHCAKEFEDST